MLSDACCVGCTPLLLQHHDSASRMPCPSQREHASRPSRLPPIKWTSMFAFFHTSFLSHDSMSGCSTKPPDSSRLVSFSPSAAQLHAVAWRPRVRRPLSSFLDRRSDHRNLGHQSLLLFLLPLTWLGHQSPLVSYARSSKPQTCSPRILSLTLAADIIVRLSSRVLVERLHVFPRRRSADSS